MSNEARQEIVTILADGTVSGVIDFQGYTLLALKLETMVGTLLTFLASESETGSFKAVMDDEGVAVSLTITDDSVIGLDSIAGKIAALPFVKFVSNATETSEVDIIVFLQR